MSAITRGLFLCLVFTQVQAPAQCISFLPQPESAIKAQTGKRIKDVQLISTLVCPTLIDGKPGPGSVNGGAVYNSAAAQGYLPILPSNASAIINVATANSWPYRLNEAVRYLSIAGAVAGAGKLNPTWIQILTGAHSLGDEIQAQAQTRLPNPVPLVESMPDPQKPIDLTHGCWGDNILISIKAKKK